MVYPYPEFGAVTQPSAGSEVSPSCLRCDLARSKYFAEKKLVYVSVSKQ